MTPDLLTSFFENWGTLLFLIFTAASTTSSIIVKIMVSFVKNKQEFEPDYKPGKALVFCIALLQAFALNSPSAASIIKGK
jgi:hypothetical protein